MSKIEKAFSIMFSQSAEVRRWRLINPNMSKTAKLTKSDELLLQDFSASVSRSGAFLFYGVAVAVSLAPIYLYYEVHQMEISESWFVWVGAVIGVIYLLAQSYKNTKHVLKHQIVVKRGEAIAKELNRLLGDDKKITKKEKEDRILWKKNEVGDQEATVFTLYYNNLIFYAAFLVFSFFLFANISPIFNCLLSMYGAGGVVLLISTAK